MAKTKSCENCKAHLYSNSIYCHKCGVKVKKEAFDPTWLFIMLLGTLLFLGIYFAWSAG